MRVDHQTVPHRCDHCWGNHCCHFHKTFHSHWLEKIAYPKRSDFGSNLCQEHLLFPAQKEPRKKKQAMKCISHVYGIMNNLKLNNFFFLLLCSGSDHLFCYVTTKTISFVMLWLKPSLMLFNDSKLSSPLSSHFVNSTYHDHVFLVTPLCYVSLPSPLLTQTVPAISFIILFNTLTTHLLNHHEHIFLTTHVL